jgi:hypothetical protein
MGATDEPQRLAFTPRPLPRRTRPTRRHRVIHADRAGLVLVMNLLLGVVAMVVVFIVAWLAGRALQRLDKDQP